MSKFRSRLLFALITLIIVVLVGLGLLLGQLFKTFYNNTFNQRMEKEASLVTLIVQEEEIDNSNIQSRINKMAFTLNSRITIMTKDGALLYDTGQLEKTNIINHNEMIKQIIRKNGKKDEGFYVVDGESDLYYYGNPLLSGKDLEGYVVLSTPVNSLQNVNQQIWGLLITSLGMSLLVILFMGVKITTQYTRPIEAATKVAIELANGNYQARTYENHLDETGMLSQSINTLARNLQDMTQTQEMQQDRLRTVIENMGSGLILIDRKGYINLVNRAYKEIFQVDPVDYLYRLYYEAFEHKEVISLIQEIFMTEVKVRKQMLFSLNIERRHFEVYGAPIIGTNDEWKGIVVVFHDITELKKLEQIRKDFVANVSHELKTPITSIKGFSETLIDGAMKDEQLGNYFLSIILKESERMESLIQDLLDLSKIEQQGFKLAIQHVDISEVLEEIIIMLQGKAEEKKVQLKLESKEKRVNVVGDVHRLKQIFINLINNAIAYTPPAGEVNVFFENLENEVNVRVRDTGVGIKEEEIPRIFERFYRVDKARSRNSGGTGLGLAIVKHLVEAHNGSISVQSKTGEGATFSVILKKEKL